MAPEADDELNEKNPRPLDEDDIALLKTYGLGPYSESIKKAEKEIKEMVKKINDLCDTGLAAPSQWDLVSDKQMMQEEQPLQVVELPMLHPEKFVKLGIDPPKGVLCYGPPGTGKTLLARAVANRTDACFIRVIGSELVQKYVGEGARMMARSKKACIVFFDEVDAIGGARFDDGVGGDNEVQRTMLEIVNQLDGFDARGNIKVLMATNRFDSLMPDTLDRLYSVREIGS
ncbi:26S protease regulatory subunit 7 [Ananas comosus]|uniref:26S protease regulatory subunit 7 n=1 Tax=Ananas comosus TaxID=4615 RepID=A0A199VZC2_ANACO|nr:26S protease regulatory subunit 7 [Ananas comosus]